MTATSIRRAGASAASSCASRRRPRWPAARHRAWHWPPAGTASDGQTYKARVSLDEDSVLSWEHRPGEQANFTEDEFYEANATLAKDPRVLETLARYGVHDVGLVLFDTWAYGAHLVDERYRGRRVGWTDVWIRNSETANPYANPISGLTFVIDANSMELLDIEEIEAGERPKTMGEYVPALVPGQRLRDDLRPLEITQPDGVSFSVEGNQLEWQRWSMRLGFNPREGLVVHTVGYEDGGRVRPVAHRMSFAEMVVPYRDPTADHMRRTAFDIGEWGLGFMTTSLELGCDCVGDITYLDAVVHDSKGEPRTIKNAICIHEEDDAVLWKHVDPVAGTEVRRSRRLVVSCHATVANYEYLVYWRFYQDGSIECEVRATGIMVTTHFAEDTQPEYGSLVDERTYAPFHQHFIVARLDLDVDGESNTVHMTESEALPIIGGQPRRARDRAALDPPAHRGGGQAGLRLGHAAGLEGREPRHAQRTGRPRGLQARARRLLPRDDGPVLPRVSARSGDRPHALGHALLRGRALAVRRVSGAGRGGRRTARLDRAEPSDREHRCGALVRVRPPSRDAPGGVAGDAGRHRLVLAQAIRVLRSQPGARRPARAWHSRRGIRVGPQPDLSRSLEGP